MYFLSLQYVKELDPGKPELAENNGFEPIASLICTRALCLLSYFFKVLIKELFSVTGTGGE